MIGAGIAGLATAGALQQHGHSVTVVEERTDTGSGAGISIWPNALAALDVLGLGHRVRTAGGRVTGGAIRWRDGSWLRRPSPERIVTALGEPLVVIQRAALRDVLTSALAPGTVVDGVAARAMAVNAGRVRIEMSDSTVREADAVVGADGTHSVVARHLNGPLTHRYAGYTAWRGVSAMAVDDEVAGETVGPGVEVGHVPMGAERTYWFATERVAEGSRAAQGELPYLRAKFASWAEPVPVMLAATDPADVLRNDLYDRDPARRWAGGPVVLVGDAAHPMRPHLGQGGCQALEDAAVLAAMVDLCPSLPAAFSAFESFRRRRVAGVVRESRTLGRLVNVRPAALSAVASRASVLVPEALVTRHLATIAARSAFRLPTQSDAQPA